MNIPPWLVMVVAVWVILFGLYRLRLSFRRPPSPDDPNFHKKGLFAGNPRRHFLLGVIYLVLGTYLVLASLGKNPVRGSGCSPAPSGTSSLRL